MQPIIGVQKYTVFFISNIYTQTQIYLELWWPHCSEPIGQHRIRQTPCKYWIYVVLTRWEILFASSSWWRWWWWFVIYRPDIYNTRNNQNLWQPLAITWELLNLIEVFMFTARLQPTSSREETVPSLWWEFTVHLEHQQWQQMECTHTLIPSLPSFNISGNKWTT